MRNILDGAWGQNDLGPDQTVLSKEAISTQLTGISHLKLTSVRFGEYERLIRAVGNLPAGEQVEQLTKILNEALIPGRISNDHDLQLAETLRSACVESGLSQEQTAALRRRILDQSNGSNGSSSYKETLKHIANSPWSAQDPHPPGPDVHIRVDAGSSDPAIDAETPEETEAEKGLEPLKTLQADH